LKARSNEIQGAGDVGVHEGCTWVRRGYLSPDWYYWYQAVVIQSKRLIRVCKFLSRLKATIELDKAYIPHIQRTHGLHIADSILASSTSTTVNYMPASYYQTPKQSFHLAPL
jgi:hypothetical protein